MQACVRACVLVFVEGASSLFLLRVCGYNDYTPFIYKQSPKSILFISDTGRGSSVVACKLHKQVLRSILVPGYSFVGSNG